MPAPPPISQMLAAWRNGDEDARERLFALMYEDLRVLAHRQRRNWHGNYTMNTTALVHELYLRMAAQTALEARDRAHFNMLAARALRHVLVDYARTRKRRKRGGDVPKVALDAYGEAAHPVHVQAEEMLDIDAALGKLAAHSERLVQVVELHFFAGLSYDEIADTLGVAKKTVARDWQKAKVLLRRWMPGRPTRGEAG